MINEQIDKQSIHAFLQGGGSMGELIRAKDWSETRLGDPATWPSCLRLAVSIMLSTPFPMYIAWGQEYTQLYNDGYRPILGNLKHPHALGNSTRETFAEIWHIIESMFAGVMAGQAVGFPNFMLPLNRNGYVEECYFDFSYSPIRDEEGEVHGVLVTVIETTDSRKLIDELKEDSAAQRLYVAQLEEANSKLLRTMHQLEESELRFQNLVREASVGIIVLIGEEMRVEVVNQAYAKLIDRNTEDLIGKPLFSIVPEVEEHFWPIINKVRVTGEALYSNDYPYFYLKNDNKIDGFLNLVYQPYRELDGTITGVIVLCQDVTEQINARQELERAYEQVRLSKEAAALGTFDMDIERGTMEWDTRCRELFGINHSGPVTYEHDFVNGLHPEDRERITEIIDNVMVKSITNGIYDVEYRTVGFEDRKLRWVKAKGQVYFNTEDKPTRFIGSVIDITEQKLDELRKNDFIGMVSHELKTPLTSLNAYVQVLENRAKKREDEFESGAFVKVRHQVNRMRSLITGFLNISRLDSGKIYLNLKQFELMTLLRDSAEEAVITSPNKDIIVQPYPPVMITADRDKIEQVILNFSNNAVKYSPKGKKITISCKESDDCVVVSVTDEGMGIRKENLSRIFERYYRVDSAHMANVSGFGIGLYLCSEIIQRHNGKIWVESEHGKGSIFYFSLPLKQS